MKRSLHGGSGFSLVEVTLALGIAAFCLIAVFGLIPVGVQTNRNATSQTAATNIIAFVVADLRANFKAANPPNTWRTPLLCIILGSSTTLYFDSQGRCSSNLAGSTDLCGNGFLPVVQTRYRLNITFPAPGNLTYAQLNVTWPAAATTANASGSVEMFAALDRN
jgi:type II secretory pathway pseudopilin PulG